MKYNLTRIGLAVALSMVGNGALANTPPQITGKPQAEILAGDYYLFTPHATDVDLNNGDKLSYQVSGLPDWATFNPSTGEISGMAFVEQAQIRATRNVYVVGYLNRYRRTVVDPTFNAEDAKTYNFKTFVTIFDDLGASHQLGIYFVQDLRFGGVWNVYFTVDGTDISLAPGTGITGPVVVNFDSLGEPAGLTSVTFNLNRIISVAENITLNWRDPQGWREINEYGGQNVITSITQDGVSAAQANNTAQIILSAIDSKGASAQLTPFNINVIPEVNQDIDGDLILDPLDKDDDNDGVLDTIDAFKHDATEWSDTDLDGIGDNQDNDDDNDGLADNVDPAPLHSSVNRAPSLFGVPRNFVFHQGEYRFIPRATDPDGDVLTYSIKNKPSWATFDVQTGELKGSKVDYIGAAYRATTNVYLAMNLDARYAPPTRFVFDVNDIGTYSYKVEHTIYDSYQQGHVLGIYFVKNIISDNVWDIYLTLDGTELTGVAASGITGPGIISFDSSGSGVPSLLPSIVLNGGNGTIGLTSLLSNGARFPSSVTLNWRSADGTELPTQLPSNFSVTSIENDGTPCCDSRNPQLPTQATSNVYMTMNLDAFASTPIAGPFNPSDTQTYNHKFTRPVFDSLGAEHELGIYFVKASDFSPNTWNVHLSLDGDDLSAIAGTGVGGAAGMPVQSMTFTSSGQPAGPSLPPITITGGTWGSYSTGGTLAETLTINWRDADNTLAPTQYASPFEGVYYSQDGVPLELARANSKIEITVTDSKGASATLAPFNIEVIRYRDTDGDMVTDNNDLDDDNDGIVDEYDLYPLDTDNDGINNVDDPDDDGDGVADALDAFALDKNESVDTDGDGIGNNADYDDDADGILDTADSFPLDPVEYQDHDHDGIGNNADGDDDGDGVADGVDPFPLDGSEWADFDGDGLGDNTDDDDDNDGVKDTDDAFPTNRNESLDTDKDGIGNNADLDDDNDGVADINDAFPLNVNESVDTDLDGIGNNADLDDDNDSLTDVQEVSDIGTNPLLFDTDGDGLSDGVEVNQHKTNPLLADTDSDGLTDGYEVSFNLDPLTPEDSANVDVDNDGLSNLQEMNLGTDPQVADTDQDGLDDGAEVNTHKTDPLNADSDGDSLSDLAEIEQYASNPLKADSDDDQMPDNWEAQYGLKLNDDDATLDKDVDGRDNLTEFNDNTNPLIAEIVDKEGNETLATAQNIDAGFNLVFSPDIGDVTQNTSTSVPHATIMGQGSGDQDVDYYGFTLSGAGKIILDIDYDKSRGGRFDSLIELYDAQGNFVATNDDANWFKDGQGGSTSVIDSYLEMSLAQPGVYYIKVVAYGSDAIPQGSSYTLQVSVEHHQVPVTP